MEKMNFKWINFKWNNINLLNFLRQWKKKFSGNFECVKRTTTSILRGYKWIYSD